MAILTLRAIKDRLDFYGRLKDKNQLDDVIYKLIGRNFYRASPKRRQAQVRSLEREVIRLFKKEYLPEAVEIGRRSAKRFIKSMGGGVLASPVNRARIRKQFKTNIKAQYEVFRYKIRREARHKLAEVETFFMEGEALGRTKKDISAQLMEMHGRERKAVAKAQAAGKSLRSVKTFAARFDTAVKGVIRDTFRRSAQQAEFAEYKENGYGANGFVWITANGGKSCPDCNAFHGVLMGEKEWVTHPGDGATVCGAACQCTLEPAEYVQGNKSLVSPLNYRKPVLLESDDMAVLDAHRVDPKSVTDGLPKTRKAKQPGKGK